ncbi:MAG: hypothetical protein JXA15_00105 [Spirochaetales bacterium]|nr:hypothetical protein [Spirochaetales bacterium]
MKRSIIALTLATAASLAYGQALSAGISFQASPYWLYEKGGTDKDNHTSTILNELGMGFGVFVDASYVQASLGYRHVAFNGATQAFIVDGEEDSSTSYEDNGAGYAYLSVELLGKYPIGMGGFTLNPLLGFGFDLCLGVTDGNGDPRAASDIMDLSGAEAGFSYYNVLSLKAGVSADFDAGERFYVRPEALFFYALHQPQLADWNESASGMADYVRTGIIGLDLGLRVGYRL